MVELDVKALVDAFKNPSYANTIFSSIFDDCRHLATQIPHLSIKHIYREANRCADRLAILGSCQVVDFISYSCPPVDLLPLVVALGDGCKQALSWAFVFSLVFLNEIPFHPPPPKKKNLSLYHTILYHINFFKEKTLYHIKLLIQCINHNKSH